jgi:hypothetical protein
MGPSSRRLWALVIAANGLACSAGTLTAVDPCPAGTASADGMSCGLVGLWHLDEEAGATVAVDASGNHNDGKLFQLDPATAWVTSGKVGNALAVDGLGYVEVPLSDSIAGIVSAVTVSAWVYLDGSISATDEYGTALSRQLGTALDQYYHLSLYKADAEPSLWITPSNGVTPVHPLAPAITPRTWTHLAGTYDGKVAILYVGGTRVAMSAITGMFSGDSTTVILGGNRNNQTVTELFPGRIDEIALYNRALTDVEIQRLAKAASF